jgi:hypothetical protein
LAGAGVFEGEVGSREVETMRSIRTLIMAAGALAIPLVVVGGTGSWIHVAVDEGHGKATSVRVNLPIMAVEAVTPLIQQEWKKNAKIGKEAKGIDKPRLVEIWKAVKDGGDAEFVTVRGEGDDVRVAKIGGKLVVKVHESGKGKDTVTVEIPGEVADALLSGPGPELDFGAALAVLRDKGHGTLVTVDDSDTKVRIWIDDRNASE